MGKSELKDETDDQPDESAGIDAGKGNAGSTDYTVGRGRPPRHSRFQPGQSGNPKGRPVGSANVNTMVKRIVNKKVTVREGKRTRKMPMLEAAMHIHATKAIQGDARSAGLLFGAVYKAGLLTDQGADARGLAALVLPTANRRLSAEFFENIDSALLSDDEKIELSRLAEVVDGGGGMTALNLDDFARACEIIRKGRGGDGG
jgi:hypothetical protein